jgi:hypothetical protein
VPGRAPALQHCGKSIAFHQRQAGLLQLDRHQISQPALLKIRIGNYGHPGEWLISRRCRAFQNSASIPEANGQYQEQKTTHLPRTVTPCSQEGSGMSEEHWEIPIF